MTMSMYSSYTPEDFNNEEDIFGKFAYAWNCHNMCMSGVNRSFIRIYIYDCKFFYH